MAVNLTDTWNAHAFPDDHPAKEQVWAQDAEVRRNETRREIYLEQSGSDLRIRRHTSDKTDRAGARAAKGRALDDMMLLAVGSPAYMEAYNHQLTFTVDGEEFDITQGQLHDSARDRAEDLQRQIDDARRRGASADDITRLQGDLDALRIIQAQTDPQHGQMDPDRHQAVQTVLQQRPGLRSLLEQEARTTVDFDGAKSQSADMSLSLDSDAKTEAALSQWASPDERSSFAGTLEASPFEAVAVSPSQDFALAAANTSTDPQTSPDQPEPSSPNNNSGFKLG